MKFCAERAFEDECWQEYEKEEVGVDASEILKGQIVDVTLWVLGILHWQGVYFRLQLPHMLHVDVVGLPSSTSVTILVVLFQKLEIYYLNHHAEYRDHRGVGNTRLC